MFVCIRTTGQLIRASPTTRVGIEGRRDVGFSYQPLRPYFLTTSAGLSVAQVLPYTLIGSVRVRLERLDYRALTSASLPAERDLNATYTIALAYRIGRHLVLNGFAESQSRSAQTEPVGYRDQRLGTSLTYEF